MMTVADQSVSKAALSVGPAVLGVDAIDALDRISESVSSLVKIAATVKARMLSADGEPPAVAVLFHLSTAGPQPATDIDKS